MDAWLQSRGVTLVGARRKPDGLPEVLAHHAGSIRVLHTLRPFAVAMAANAIGSDWGLAAKRCRLAAKESGQIVPGCRW